MNLLAPRAEVRARSVLLVSTDAALRARLRKTLGEMRWQVREAAGGADALAQMEAFAPETLVLDSWLPDLEVGDFVRQVRGAYEGVDLLRFDGGVVVGASASPRRNQLLHALRESSGPLADVVTVTAVVRGMESPSVEALPGMVGSTAAMVDLARLVRLVAPTMATVLIEGETGTGKELVAQAVHRLSTRCAKPFAVLNCAAIPEALLEAELFGHTRGAFTGAVQARTGRIEAADGGTLFLDEIGEMPLALQAKMLRFLECGELQRIGDNETVKVDVRIVAATHRDLEKAAETGAFRLDLYHRLAVFPLEVPALRERMADVPVLVEFLLAEMGRRSPRKRLSSAAMERLQMHEWPGNVRELGHVLERGAILAGGAAEISVDEIRFRRASK